MSCLLGTSNQTIYCSTGTDTSNYLTLVCARVWPPTTACPSSKTNISSTCNKSLRAVLNTNRSRVAAIATIQTPWTRRIRNGTTASTLTDLIRGNKNDECSRTLKWAHLITWPLKCSILTARATAKKLIGGLWVSFYSKCTCPLIALVYSR